MTRAGLGSTRVELFEAIRRDARRENASVRELARRYSVHRRTVRQALASASPPARKVPVRKAPRLDPVKPLIDAMLREDLTAPRKQRHTARRILARLVDEHGHADLKYPTVRDYVARRRAEIALEAGNPAVEAMVPQSHEPGAEAEVDFAELYVDLAGCRTKVFLFTLRLSYSGRAVHRVFASQGQEAFLEGHIHAFERLGGVPWERIRYDNLKAAVSRVLFGRDREESDRWVEFRSHYGFDAFYCRPGVEGAHEKGGVEGEGGRFRRTHLVPVPQVASIAELNTRLAAFDDADDARRITNRARIVGDDFVPGVRGRRHRPGRPRRRPEKLKTVVVDEQGGVGAQLYPDGIAAGRTSQSWPGPATAHGFDSPRLSPVPAPARDQGADRSPRDRGQDQARPSPLGRRAHSLGSRASSASACATTAPKP